MYYYFRRCEICVRNYFVVDMFQENIQSTCAVVKTMVVYSICILFNVCLKCTYLLCVCLCMPYIQWYCLHLLCICLNNNKIAYISICLVSLILPKTCTEDSRNGLVLSEYTKSLKYILLPYNYYQTERVKLKQYLLSSAKSIIRVKVLL